MSGSDTILKAAVGALLDEEIKTIPSGQELEENIHVSDEFVKKMKRLLFGFHVREGALKVAKNVAAVFAVAIIGFMLAFAVNENVRAWTIQFLRSFVENQMTAYRFPDTEISGTEGSDADMAGGKSEKSSGANERTVKGIELTYVPEGFELTMGLEEPFDEDFGSIIYEKDFGKETENVLDFVYSSNPTEDNNSIDHERNILKHITLEDGTDCDFYQAMDRGDVSSLVWRWGDVLYTLSINNYQEGWEEEELIKTANGIRIIYDER